jgi:hypothetical protein
MATKSQSNGKVETLPEQHARLIAEYGSAFGAAKAQISRRIVETQLDMALEGIEFEPWTKPSDYRTRYELSESQLRTQVEALRGIVAGGDHDDATKAAAERRLGKFEEQAQKRGVAL